MDFFLVFIAASYLGLHNFWFSINGTFGRSWLKGDLKSSFAQRKNIAIDFYHDIYAIISLICLRPNGSQNVLVTVNALGKVDVYPR